MNDDELRARLMRADPARQSAGADSWIDDLVGATMDTDTSNERPRGRRPWVPVAAAAAAVVAIGGVAFALTDGDDVDNGQDQAADPRKELALTLAPVDSMQMCIEFSPDVLEPMDVAFSGEAY